MRDTVMSLRAQRSNPAFVSFWIAASRYALLAMTIMALAAPAHADIPKPKPVASVIKALKPHGEGTLSRLWIKVYTSRLWLDGGAWSMDRPFALVNQYFVSIEASDLIDRTIEEMQHITELNADQLEGYRRQLEKVFPPIRKGDTLTGLYQPGKGVSFYANDTLTGKVEDDEFATLFFAIWLDPKTSEPELRKALLGGKVE